MKCSCLSLFLRISGGYWEYKTFHIVEKQRYKHVTLVDVSVLINWSISPWSCLSLHMPAHRCTTWLRSNLETKSSSSICRQNQNLCNLLTRDARKCNGLASSTEFATFEHNAHPHKETLAQRNPRLKVCSKFTTYCSSNRNSKSFPNQWKKIGEKYMPSDQHLCT